MCRQMETTKVKLVKLPFEYLQIRPSDNIPILLTWNPFRPIINLFLLFFPIKPSWKCSKCGVEIKYKDLGISNCRNCNCQLSWKEFEKKEVITPRD